MTENTSELEQYANVVKECLEKITHDYGLAPDEKIQVVYTSSSMAYAKAQQDFSNGRAVGPLISFRQSGLEVIREQQMGAFFRMPVHRKQGDYSLRAPLIVQLDYDVTINALTESEADLLLTQILKSTSFTRPYYTMLNGQYVLIRTEETSFPFQFEMEENKDKVSKRELKLIIERAYLNYEIKENYAGTIKYKKTTDEEVEGTKLANGAILTEDGEIVNGEVIRNLSCGKDGFFKYKVVDEDGETIDVISKGKVKLRFSTMEDTK